MRVVLVAAAMLVAALAGCMSGSDEDAADVVPELETAPKVNHAPTANLTADLVNGTAPMNVTFTLSGFDADLDNLTWSLTLGNLTLGNGTVGGNATGGNATSSSTTGPAGNAAGNATGNGTGNATGTRLARTLAHQFTEAGNYSVVLNVTDGTNRTLANLTVTVHSAGNATTAVVPHEDDYVIFNADGTCDAKGEIAAGAEYIHHRGGDSVWFYEESNGVDGLQVGGSGLFGSEEDAYVACLNPDFLVF